MIFEWNECVMFFDQKRYLRLFNKKLEEYQKTIKILSN